MGFISQSERGDTLILTAQPIRGQLCPPLTNKRPALSKLVRRIMGARQILSLIRAKNTPSVLGANQGENYTEPATTQ